MKIEAGAEVWILERDSSGFAYDVSAYMFLAESGESVIVSSYINDLESLEETLAYHQQETRENYDTPLAVYPAEDCYTDRIDAFAAMREERHKDEEMV